MILEPKPRTLYQPAAACWLCEDKTVKQVSKDYANVIQPTAWTTKAEADKMAASQATNPAKAVIVKEITANISLAESCWRLVHDGANVLALFKDEGETWTINTLFCATTEKECQSEIDRLGLIPLTF